MPIYDFKCPTCGTVTDVYAHMDEREKMHSCGQTMTRLISTPNITPDIPQYLDENLGETPVLVKSRRHRKQLMKERGLVEIG